MRTLIVFLVGSFFLGCGGGGDGEEEVPVVVAAPEAVPTPIEVTNCGDITVDLEAADEIVDAAIEEGVDVEDVVDELPPPSVPEFNFGQPTAKTGVIIAACGSTVVTDDSISDDDTNNVVINPAPAQRLLELIHAGEIQSIEVRR